MNIAYKMEALSADRFPEFLAYLNAHLTENGGPETGYFQPQPRGMAEFPPERAAAFERGLGLSVGEPGWRRAWLARSQVDRAILGHIDLRAQAMPFAEHRALLGMGVHASARRQGLGQALIAHARDWSSQQTGLHWIDLQVLSSNRAALRLYLNCGFVVCGEREDLFRLEGQSLGETSMSLRLRAAPPR
ncbi:GNAT family N-acetyltransferase [Paucibacter sp. DJ1R-11]|uniref:GNAT family N-acetyltransferase n=1 Tax=Paucibacter sp. DJ1R-11 TaxID=2893556 RepID=UPI0021E3CF9B|nr:GNAT family N-acetyltransferase [Paucibacter sp. DJ1R-11]MCV2362968.1 GNAT family N-acetyltransferase [Paucibacter sp. DJ1R-11]